MGVVAVRPDTAIVESRSGQPPAAVPGPRAEAPVTPELGDIAVSLTAHEVRTLSSSIPGIVHGVRRQLSERGDPGDQVTVDLSAVPPVPACAPLLSLFGLVRRTVGPKPLIVVTGANAALAACLVADLPDGVVLVDRRGRRWPG